MPLRKLPSNYSNWNYQPCFSSYHTIETATSLVSSVFEEAVKNLSAKDTGVCSLSI